MIDFYKLAFGTNDHDTIRNKEALYRLLGPRLMRWQEAYDACFQHIKELVGFDSSSPEMTVQRVQSSPRMDTGEPLDVDPYGASFAQKLGKCCVELSKRHQRAGDRHQAKTRGEEAVTWYRITLHQIQDLEGAEFYLCQAPMMDLAEGYECAGQERQAMYWYARSMVCATRVEPPIFHFHDQRIEDNIKRFEDKKESLWFKDLCKAKDDELNELIHDVDGRIRKWTEERDERVAEALANACEEEPVDWDEVLRLPVEPVEEDVLVPGPSEAEDIVG